MGRLAELYANRDVHVVWTVLLTLVTNCRYIVSHQPYPGCATFPLAMQCFGIPCVLASAKGRRHPFLQATVPLLGLSSLACVVLSLVHLRHLLPSTLSVLNAYVLLVLAGDVRLRQAQDGDVVLASVA
jgi:hypothetical protein